MAVRAFRDGWGRICLQRSCGGFWMTAAELTAAEADELGRDLVGLAAAEAVAR